MDGSLTYMHAATASVSAVDLSNFSPIIFLDLQWKVHDDLCRSDYYQISTILSVHCMQLQVGHFAMQTGPHGWR